MTVKTGLFFGSFNPVHIGHLAIANYFKSFSDLEEIWMVVSPHNPLKKKKSLLNQYDRLDMLNMALKEAPEGIHSCDIEFQLKQPSYTIDTLTYLKERHPTNEFAIIVGSDNLASFHKWKNYEEIIRQYQIYVYPRPGFDMKPYENHPKFIPVDAPVMEISSSFIRNAIKKEKDIRCFLPKEIYHYILKMHFYK